MKKNGIKNSLSAFSVVVIELGLMVAATTAFISAFHYVDAKKALPRNPAGSVASASASSAPAVSSGTQPGAGGSAAQTAAVPKEQLDDWRLLLVNFDHKVPDNYQHTIVHELGVDIDSRIVTPYEQMRDAAQKDNIKLWISSAYRSPERQQVLFEQEIQNYSKTGLNYVDALAKAESSVARAGYSEHNTGLAIDLNGVLENFGGTPASDWLQEHSADYGFVLRYPADKQSITKIKYEPWHYRYVGVESAKEMNRLGMCLEEYVDYLKQNQNKSN